VKVCVKHVVARFERLTDMVGRAGEAAGQLLDGRLTVEHMRQFGENGEARSPFLVLVDCRLARFGCGVRSAANGHLLAGGRGCVRAVEALT
jgi:hypothetical protein